MAGFLHYRFGGLIFGGAYFRNFTVYGKEPGYNETSFVILRFHCTYFGSIIMVYICSLLQCNYCNQGHLNKIDQSARITGR